jgi:hypothetical protein
LKPGMNMARSIINVTGCIFVFLTYILRSFRTLVGDKTLGMVAWFYRVYSGA